MLSDVPINPCRVSQSFPCAAPLVLAKFSTNLSCVFHKCSRCLMLLFVYTGEVNIDDEEEEVCRDVVGPDIEVAINMYSVHTK